jgi:hypothetical protein
MLAQTPKTGLLKAALFLIIMGASVLVIELLDHWPSLSKQMGGWLKR